MKDGVTLLQIARAWGHLVLFVATACLLQRLTALDAFISPGIPRLASSTDIATLCLMTWLGGIFLLRPVSVVWNRITPYKDRATLIETEICSALARGFGTAAMSAVWLSIPSILWPELLALCLLCTVPGMAYGYVALRIFYETRSEPEKAEISAQTPPDDAKDWSNAAALIASSAVFNLTTAIAICGIALAMTGTMPPLQSLLVNCGGLAFFLMAIFGNGMVAIGHACLSKIYDSRASDIGTMLAYATGVLACLLPFAALGMLGGAGAGTPLWAFALAYTIIGLCALPAGWVYAVMNARNTDDDATPVAEVFA